jgi:hypothetical protein
VQSLPAGAHWLSVRQVGRRTRNLAFDLKRGDEARFDVELETTTQRRVAWAVGIAGAASLVATGTFTGLAWHQDSKASDFDRLRSQGQLTADQGAQLNAAIDDRDRYRSYAIGMGITSAALLGLAAILYLSDSPEPPKRPERLVGSVQSPNGGALTFHF